MGQLSGRRLETTVDSDKVLATCRIITSINAGYMSKGIGYRGWVTGGCFLRWSSWEMLMLFTCRARDRSGRVGSCCRNLAYPTICKGRTAWAQEPTLPMPMIDAVCGMRIPVFPISLREKTTAGHSSPVPHIFRHITSINACYNPARCQDFIVVNCCRQPTARQLTHIQAERTLAY